MLQQRQKVLAKAPSTHDPKRTTAQLNMSQPRRGGDNTHGKMEQIGLIAVVFMKPYVIAYE
jgi:hypothetical protein